MPDLPTRFAGLILAFAPLFVHRSWRHAQLLLIGAILTLGRRTVASVLRIMGRAQDRRFVNIHRILNRAAWCPRTGGRILLGLLIAAFAPRGPVIMALDNTIERRRGKRITAKGIDRDPVRSSDSHFVKASGLRWTSPMLLAPIPWAGRVWALPFLTALVPSERACRERDRRHKPLLDVGRQLALQARRWLRGRDVVLAGDGSFSALLFLDAMRRARITGITRLRRDAALYEPARLRLPGTIGRPRTKGARLPTLAATLVAKDTPWRSVMVPGWYGSARRGIEVASGTAVWRHGGMPVVPIRSRARARSSPALRAPGVALHRPRPRPSPDRIMVRPPLERRGHLPGGTRPSRRRDESGSGPIRRLLAPSPACSPCSRSSPCWLRVSRLANGDASRPPRGTPNRARPSPTRWPPCATRSGASGLWRHHRADALEQNLASACHCPGPMPSATLHDWPKSS
ncbi:transposase [uncultured Methylobacterium sp.]|uniref:IS701 family transposase n=1 Tax=uncultured Methylobacterium sp. TaxID=157278 RepID=UPI002594C404|nr:transposase [uncultured Methylobacterium sp.]